jgi:hypothetical protein
MRLREPRLLVRSFSRVPNNRLSPAAMLHSDVQGNGVAPLERGNVVSQFELVARASSPAAATSGRRAA